jgi:hypothetical protein
LCAGKKTRLLSSVSVELILPKSKRPVFGLPIQTKYGFIEKDLSFVEQKQVSFSDF